MVQIRHCLCSSILTWRSPWFHRDCPVDFILRFKKIKMHTVATNCDALGEALADREGQAYTTSLTHMAMLSMHGVYQHDVRVDNLTSLALRDTSVRNLPRHRPHGIAEIHAGKAYRAVTDILR